MTVLQVCSGPGCQGNQTCVHLRVDSYFCLGTPNFLWCLHWISLRSLVGGVRCGCQACALPCFLLYLCTPVPIFPVPHSSHSPLANLYVCFPYYWDRPFPKPLSAAFRTFVSCPGTIPLSTKAGASLPPNLWILLRPHTWASLQLWCFLLLWFSFPFPKCDCLSQGLIAMNRPHDQCNSCKDNI